ncbi:hypothetical protein SLS62_001256 [Diatrype stigma]|uniref:J domain-containing protein n=1 Tax=Diatrype stigma TaxID=117547 RepID=A0AAN9V0C8_9PEZI
MAAALKTHPDRVPADSPERPVRTRRFQLVNDAYYTLSDTSRRREYDAQRRMFGGGRGGGGRSQPASSGHYADPFEEEDMDADETVPPSGSGGGQPNANTFYSWAWNFFTQQQGQNQNQNQQQGQNQRGREGGTRQEAEDAQFADVFEEMLREEGLAEEGTNRPTSKFWSILGAASGGVMGFIVANVPGLLAGAVAGNRLGAVRDARGKSVYAVFQELPQGDRARLLAQLASRVFSHAMGV